MSKVLIISNLFHASPRIPGLATYLPKGGWEATIISPPVGDNAENYLGFPKQFLEKSKIVEAPYRGDIFWLYRKIFKSFGFKTNQSITQQIKEHMGVTSKNSFIDLLMNWYQTILAYPDTERTWRNPALKAAYDILKKEHFNAILSSSPFPTSHIVAAELRKQFGLPWLADFRDPWTQNHNYPYGVIRKYLEKKLELRTISSADAMTAAAPVYAKKQEHFHKMPTIVITNGFDPKNINDQPIELTDKFTITYTGQIYTGKQDPEKFIKALKGLISEGTINPDDIEVRFYGPRLNWLSDKIANNGLIDSINQYGQVLRYESWQKQRESHVLLLLNWEDPTERGVYPLKFFEYLSARRPILASGGLQNDDLSKMLIETKAGVYAPNIEEIKASLLRFYKEYKRTGRVPYSGDFKEIDKYSYRGMARKFSDLLNQLI